MSKDIHHLVTVFYIFPLLPVHTLSLHWFYVAACCSESKQSVTTWNLWVMLCFPACLCSLFTQRYRHFGLRARSCLRHRQTCWESKWGHGGRGRGHHSIENFHQFVLTTELILLCAQVNGDHTDPHGGPIYALEKKTPSLSGIADIYNKRHNRRQCTGNRKCLTGEVSWPYKMSGCLAALLPFGQADDVWTVTWFKAKLVFITPVTSH